MGVMTAFRPAAMVFATLALAPAQSLTPAPGAVFHRSRRPRLRYPRRPLDGAGGLVLGRCRPARPGHQKVGSADGQARPVGIRRLRLHAGALAGSRSSSFSPVVLRRQQSRSARHRQPRGGKPRTLVHNPEFAYVLPQAGRVLGNRQQRGDSIPGGPVEARLHRANRVGLTAASVPFPGRFRQGSALARLAVSPASTFRPTAATSPTRA